MSQKIDRALRHLRHSRQLTAARQRGNTVAQLEHSLHVADTMIGMSKSPSEADHWRGIHAEVRELIAESGYQWFAAAKAPEQLASCVHHEATAFCGIDSCWRIGCFAEWAATS